MTETELWIPWSDKGQQWGTAHVKTSKSQCEQTCLILSDMTENTVSGKGPGEFKDWRPVRVPLPDPGPSPTLEERMVGALRYMARHRPKLNKKGVYLADYDLAHIKAVLEEYEEARKPGTQKQEQSEGKVLVAEAPLVQGQVRYLSLPFSGRVTCHMHPESKILGVVLKGSTIYLRYEAPNTPAVSPDHYDLREFGVYSTGAEFSLDTHAYVGSVYQPSVNGLPYDRHVYEIIKKEEERPNE